MNWQIERVSRVFEHKKIYRLPDRNFMTFQAIPKGAIIPYNPDNYDISIASKYGGYDEERGGGSGKGKSRGGRDASPRSGGAGRGDYGRFETGDQDCRSKAEIENFDSCRGSRLPGYEERYERYYLTF